MPPTANAGGRKEPKITLKANATFKNAAVTFFYMNISFSLCFSIIAAENFKSLAFAAFTCIMNFKILNFMRLQKIIIKNTKSKLNVFNVVHVMRHVYMAGTDNLLKDKFFILKIRRKSFKGLVINRGRKIFFWIWKLGKLLRAVAFRLKTQAS